MAEKNIFEGNDNLYREDGINKNTYELLFHVPESEKIQNINKEDLITKNTIFEYTKVHEKIIFYKILNFIFKNEYVDFDNIKYDSETKEYKYLKNGEEYTFDILSKYVKGIDQKNFLAQLINNYEVNKELHSNARYGRCHYNAILMSEQLKNSKILTGFATFGNHKVLHSIVLKKDKKGIEVVYDWTQNLLIPFDDYKRLVNFEEITTVDREDLLNDLLLMEGTNMIDKVYLTFRDELISDMKRNEEIFKNRSK